MVKHEFHWVTTNFDLIIEIYHNVGTDWWSWWHCHLCATKGSETNWMHFQIQQFSLSCIIQSTPVIDRSIQWLWICPSGLLNVIFTKQPNWRCHMTSTKCLIFPFHSRSIVFSLLWSKCIFPVAWIARPWYIFSPLPFVIPTKQLLKVFGENIKDICWKCTKHMYKIVA